MSRRHNYLHSPEEMIAWGQSFGKQLLPGSIVALKGDLGSGKTTLVKGIVNGILGWDPKEVTSPTFTYLHIYSSSSTFIYHFDLYRLSHEADFVKLGFSEYFQSGGICCIEWSERIEQLLPPHVIKIELMHEDEETRKIRINF